jgi:hypothetical protein
MARFIACTLLAFSLLVPAGLARLAADDATRPLLSGTWKIDKATSAAPQ